MNRPAYLTAGEFELLEVLWPLGEASVRQVWERVRPRRAVAYTTVMTVLFKMHRKGMLSQRKQGKAYFYTPMVDREKALEGVLEHVLNTYFKGSQEELIRIIHKSERAGAASTTNTSHTEPSPASFIEEFLL
ncbi:MAG TPA: BlaI/MecI/CopY family transcriptional regulator [Acidobacteriota bacterium]|nr:BlaI/MecI/CopY family transcriptional regulator [Acidobacteriota bacterium]